MNNFFKKINITNNNNGFTLIELLVVFSITTILTGTLFLYSRSSEKSFLLFRDQERIKAAIVKSKNLAINTYSAPNAPCGYGVHFDYPNKTFVIFQSTSLNVDCVGMPYKFSGNASDIIETIYLDKLIDYDSAVSNLNDIIFIAPDPKIIINEDTNLATKYSSKVVIKNTIGDKREITFLKSGQISTK